MQAGPQKGPAFSALVLPLSLPQSGKGAKNNAEVVLGVFRIPRRRPTQIEWLMTVSKRTPRATLVGERNIP